MVSKISEGIKINVETFYLPEQSKPLENEFLFAYRITVENFNSFSVQLLKRHWYIFDSTGENKEVEGEGVVGVQPIIKPNNQFQYVSGCNLKSEIGKMQGVYELVNLNTLQPFFVNIPTFELIAPLKYN
jgi:ApaG protein